MSELLVRKRAKRNGAPRRQRRGKGLRSNQIDMINRRTGMNRRVRGENSIIIMNDPGRFCPDKYVCELRWPDTTLYRTNAGINVQNWYFRSSAFDPDPALLTGAIPGFVPISAMYRLYRVLEMRVHSEVANNETQPAVFGSWPSTDTNAANSLSRDDCIQYCSNPKGKYFMLGQTGGMGKKAFMTIANGESLFGPNFRTDLIYASDVTVSPSLMYNVNFFHAVPNGTIAFGVSTKIAITYVIEFFTRKQLDA